MAAQPSLTEQITTDQVVIMDSPIISPTDVRLLLFAQLYYHEQFEFFTASLEEEKIPWSFNNTGFLEKLHNFSKRFAQFLADQNTTADAITTAFPQQTLNQLVKELELVRQKEHAATPPSYINAVVAAYVKELKKQGVPFSEKEEARLFGLIGQDTTRFLEEKTLSPEDIYGFVSKEIYRASDDKTAPLIEQVVARIAPALKLPAPQGQAEKINKAIFLAPDPVVARKNNVPHVPPPQLHLYANALRNLAFENPDAPIEELAVVAKKTTEVVGVLSQHKDPRPEKEKYNTFFRDIAQTPFQKTVAAILDPIANVFGKQQVLGRVYEKVFGRIERSSESITTVFGKNIVSSPLFQQIFQKVRATVIGASSSTISRPIQGFLINLLSDVATTVFHKTIERTLVQTVGYKVVFRFAVQQWVFSQITTAAVALKGTSTASWLAGILSLGTKKAAKEGARGAAVAAAAGTVAKEGAKKGIEALLTKIGLSSLIGLFTGGAGWVAQALMWVGATLLKPILSFIGRGISGALSFSFLQRMISGQGQLSLADDWVLIVPIAIIAIFLVMFTSVLPTPLSTSYLNTLVKNGAIIRGLVGNRGLPHNILLGGSCFHSYNGPVPPQSLITECPTIGTISQCPGGDHSHGSVDAYDLTNNNGAEVRATHDGYVAYSSTGLKEKEGKGCGNQIQLAGFDGTAPYFTIYGHLKDLSPAVVAAAASGSLIPAGTIIGWVDHNGFSSGPHLHYEYRGSGKLTLPPGCGAGGLTCGN